jgi:glutathione S-transferase
MTAQRSIGGRFYPGSAPSTLCSPADRRRHYAPAPMRDLVLYGSLESGHSYKARLFLTLAEVPHRYVHVDLGRPRAERPEEFRRVSQFGEVPVLVDDGIAQAQSNAILLHLAQTTGQLGPPPGSSWDQLVTWLFWEANRSGFSMANLRYYTRFEHAEPQAKAFLRARAMADMKTLDVELSARPFIAGSTPSIADLSICAYVFTGGECGMDPKGWPNVAAWLDRIRAIPHFQPQYALMKQ